MKREFDDNFTTGKTTTGIRQKWYEEYPKAERPCKHSKSEADILYLRDDAKKCLDAETAAFQLKQSKLYNSETKWLKTALQRGTTSDKVAASIVLVQDNPKYNLSRLVSLISQVRGAKHNQCGMIIMSLKELFLTDLLHPQFKLLKLEEQDLDGLNIENEGNSIVKTNAAKNRLLAHWYFEDQLREQYEHFVQNLSAVASDTVDTNREKAISAMTDLLVGNAEQEHKLLELLVNKIGDPNNKVGSKAVFCINKLLNEHPNMKLVVLREVEKLLFRKNVSQRTQYYAICLLAQYVLNKNDEEVAATLIEVYFAFFKACLKKGEPDSRMMAAILMGVNRAYPFAKIDSKILNEHIDSIYKVVHLGSFNVSLNALSLLHQITGKDESQANRFYSAFYKKLLDRQIGVANKHAVFLNLLYRVLQRDQSILRLYAFIKRILQITFYFPANMACAMLYIVSKILQSRQNLKHILLKSHKAIKVENEVCEVNDNSSDTEDICEIENENSIMLSNVTIGADMSETKPDVKKETDIKVEAEEIKSYDPFCRNPLYAGAVKGLNTELEALSRHFHPSVALFANQIIQGKSIAYTGDPLEDLTLIRFLDRYVFKNPKKLEDKKVQKKNDPLARRAGYSPKGIRALPVDSAAYLDEREERIPVDELFLYRYLKQKNEVKKRVKKEDDDEDDEDANSVNSEEFNDMLDHMGASRMDDFDDLDIAANIIPRKKKGKTDESDDDDEDENDADDDDQFEDDDIIDDASEDLDEDVVDDDGDLQDLSDIDLEDVDDDLSDMEFNDSEDDEVVDNELISSLNKKLNAKDSKSKEKQNKKGIDSNIFVSAEKFAEMLEEQNKTRGKHGGSNVFSSSDGASVKQIDWEMKRHERIKGTFGSFKNKRKSNRSSNNNRVKRIKR
ncbi:CCAAT/enhancer-binding protein zeta [Solenopsis invicta]|uniref:CCAAT/enhancer-binding protein zeta n=1 Tax=Solenopsis invicta TaxID=13686 RepID=UPI0005961E24|nr:CCAAT/enhancer-binding protein zeta [Solenopsis invicta]XP_011162011.1 CCAAT/enhancer-binding protein zeta [Solenopsis invicta]XP_011162012.1 CCAAT/enhancer-binding protein zeta [Solenopsis invicta]XP_025986890.1 CCAAT/enhancer-binding protein zeta [Solenopsis invicta]XP_039302199.1 CCAAT/enhancer-binding protein zeta [Solenopsis invicta]XP_039302200.1 CCAAT/enhancer-binding protein zeta [Solenopsis invicta]XP_039302201.1 CCAAT/enhancer-binding protein zeta [Solenopsis invicta]